MRCSLHTPHGPGARASSRTRVVASGSARRRAVVARASGEQPAAASAAPARPEAAGAADAGAAGAPEARGAAGCPFLAALPPPPKASAPWYAWPLTILDPPAWQELAVGGRPVVAGEFLLQPAVLACTGELAREVLTSEGDKTAVGWPPHFAKLFGPESLILQTGARHRALRALMQPAFTTEAIAAFVPRVSEIVSGYLEAWAAAGGAVAGYEQLKLMTFDIIVQVVLGRPYSRAEIAELSSLYKAWLGGLFTVAPFDLPFLPYSRALRAREALGVHLRAAVAEARAAAAAGEPPRGILGNMIKPDADGNGLTDQQCEDQILLLLFAGHDTSSTTLARALWRLANAPAAWAALKAEHAAAGGGGGAPDGAALRSMPYTEAVIKEAMRCDNIIGGLPRRAARDFDLGGHLVKEGQGLLVPLTYLTRHDPRWEGDASFEPARWLSEEGQQAAQSWVMPFGAGNRYCIGAPLAMAEMKVFLSLLARGYDYSIADAANVKWSTIPLAVPKCGLPLTLTARRAAAAPAAA
ncbi:MAG: cytochrome P450 [Monoraphidium minutum]|nr:MAG: cytochrome P450 [Monoraphidium minutum]